MTGITGGERDPIDFVGFTTDAYALWPVACPKHPPVIIGLKRSCES
jgi:hypothetical protein